MYRLIRSNVAKIIFTACIAVTLIVPSIAEEISLVDAFRNADSDNESPANIFYNIDGCVFQRIIVNLKYCEFMGQGEGDRTVIQHIDLREVKEIEVGEFQGNFRVSFELDYVRPGLPFILMDRVLNGEEGTIERFMERESAALEVAELTSGTTFSSCDGSLPAKDKSSSLSVFTEVEPEGWVRLVDLARECRAPEHLTFSEK